jgi:hypothetical protein
VSSFVREETNMAEVTYEDIERLGENYYEVRIYKYGEEEPVEASAATAACGALST